MKKATRLLVGMVGCISLLAASGAVADGGFGGGHGSVRGGGGDGWHGGGGGFHGGGYSGGYRGGYGWSGYPGVAFGFGWPGYYSDYPPTYYYVPAPVGYSAPPEVIYTSPTVNFTSQSANPSSQPTASAPPASVQNQPSQPPAANSPMAVADVKALAKGGLSDEVILSQMRSRQAVFHLTTEEILDLNASQVSQKVIDYMINTATPHRD